MRKLIGVLIFILVFAGNAVAQMNEYDDGFTIVDNSFNPNRALDSLHASHKKVPKGIRVWTIDEKFGDITPQKNDTSMYLFHNTTFTAGKYGEYNTTGNLGSPRIARIATDRDYSPRFTFTEPYGYFITKVSDLRFTNTFSPITNISYYTCGDSRTGEDHLKALFATNVNKEIGFGFKFDYDYGRGYYQNQSTALFNYTMWGSYIGARYQAHLAFSFDHMKTMENGGITNDDYVTHPEAFNDTYSEDEIPVLLSNNWNRNNAFHLTFSHRYNIGFFRDEPMTEEEKNAKRFAMEAQKEREELERKNREATESTNTARSTDNKTTAKFSGRPDDAKVVGDLNTESVQEIKQKIAEQEAALKDSLAAAIAEEAPDTSWTKKVYVPVTSFIHTMQVDNHTRTYIAYNTPSNLYLQKYLTQYSSNDSIYDETKYFALRNTFAIGLLEGFNKYVPMGAKVYLTHELRNSQMPQLDGYKYDSYTETDFCLGAQLTKATGRALHYNVLFETDVVGKNIGDIRLDGDGSLRIPFHNDSLNIGLKAFYHLTNPTFQQRHYHGKYFWWDDDDMKKQMHTHLEGVFSFSRTRTTLRVAYDNLQNYTYLAESYNRSSSNNITGFTATMRQSGKNISLITASLEQNFVTGVLNWENRITFQKSSDEDVLPVPALNVWSNLYLKFRISKVLRVNFGVEAIYFTKYYAPEYCSQLGQYAVQENADVKTQTGNYPFVNVYANFKLKQCRFFVMMSHVNAGSGNYNYFLTPHHPTNLRVLRFGLSWTFNN